ncbi:MAG: aminotransferase class V-fold PLP-dependent enzyme [Oscillospiraceae bacterium]|jgi:cysteine desulfurase family protein|nr:aminotransferase class V-fold PLP-dependent enzyme [Oscillospiraceae bacterium]
MIYFDNAATTYPKPPAVLRGVSEALVKYGGNPGRGGHELSMKTAEAVFNSRMKCAEFFGADVNNTVFTLNCTHAINIAVKGVLTKGSHIIISDIEHNAVVRPVHAASKENGVSYSVALTAQDDDETVRNFEKLINKRTAAIACTAASNVTGRILPYQKIAEMCGRHGVCFILDAAQGAGVLPIKIGAINIVCVAGHKGLYGPMGTGLLLLDGKYRLKTFMEGGTGSRSKEVEQPEELPERFESGTINTPGAIALGAGVDFVNGKTIKRIHDHEFALSEYFYNGVKNNPNIILYTNGYDERRAPIVPFNIKGRDSAEASVALSKEGFYLRGGFHCAFFAHKKMGTSDVGAIRFAPSAFNTKNEVASFVNLINKKF